MQSDRAFDIVVFGATGFTGGLVAQYLARVPGELRWALAGRNREKLEAVKAALVSEHPACESVGIIEASSEDESSLKAMCAQTRVVLTTVGPYIRYGEPLVKACIAQGADYVDITGEPEFVDGMIAKYDAAAKAAKVKIVSCCGFDSIPHDLGVLYTLEHLPAGQPVKIEGFVRASGQFSGGTWNSALDAMSRIRKMTKPAKRSPAADGRRVGSTRERPRYDKSVKSWVAPMPTIDPQVVKRSARALAEYGPDFRYGHYVMVRSLPKMVAGGVGIGAVVGLAQFGPTLNLLRKVKNPGEGPDEATRAKSRFTVTFVGEAGGKSVKTTVSGGDPGYTETAKMISESALCLALDRASLPTEYGVVTTAQAMGRVLIDRLEAQGIRFELQAA
jgi:short subunit dehydrogenase-like uncharacterized protein